MVRLTTKGIPAIADMQWTACSSKTALPFRLYQLTSCWGKIMRNLALIFMFGLTIAASHVSAAVIQVAPSAITGSANGCSLVDAINAANTDTAVGACPAGTSGGNTIQLSAGTYTLTQPDNYWYGPNGLPPISSNITIVGNPSGSIIERSTASGTPPFRIFYIGGGESLTNYNSAEYNTLPGPGNLTLKNLTLQNGLAQGGDGAGGGGGGAGLGGAIYNQGTVTLSGVTAIMNQAIGGNGPGGLSGNGGGIGANATSAYSGGFDPNGLWPDSNAVYNSFGNGSTANLGYLGYVGAGGSGGSNGGNGGYGGGGGASQGNGAPGIGGFGGGGGHDATGCYSSTFGANNSPSGAGLGGVVFNEGGNVILVNSTLTKNNAQSGNTPSSYNCTSLSYGYGGGIFNLNGTVNVSYSTLAYNTVTTGGGAVYNLYFTSPGSPAGDQNLPATMTVNSSILAGSLSGTTPVSDCENNGTSAIFTSGFDFVQTSGSCTFNNNDQTGIPRIASSLANNGGPTQTIALLSTSLAINAGDPTSPPAVDQRDYARSDGSPDIGAFEYGATSEISVTGLSNTSITAGSTVPPQTFTLTDQGNSAMTVSATSDNATLLPDSGIQVSTGCGSSASQYTCMLSLTPTSGQTGTANVELVATDSNGNSSAESFTLTVNPASSGGGGSGGGSGGGGGTSGGSSSGGGGGVDLAALLILTLLLLGEKRRLKI